MIALVPQYPFIIAGTIKDNICYGIDRDVTIDEIKAAASKAYIDDFIESLPNSYDTLLSEDGSNLLQKENDTTIISIAHRLTTLENCDSVLVFDKGHIIQKGKYKDLIEIPGTFQDMYNGKIK